tara:strand:- start:3537 stop:3701 length:165 start_codon:yes stop_codon:yes gene_type:complete
MNKLFGITLLTILVSCGGGGGSVASSGGSSPSAASGSAPTGNFASQVDPVQATE